ncbi:MAG: hypothetical protein HGA45_20000, partial [Chloroflexales bacterium]|nr:hypothetical protein [Chloroflexales bacterium]
MSRALPRASYRPLHLTSRPDLSAVVAGANPPTLSAGMDPIQVADEVARARQGRVYMSEARMRNDARPSSTLARSIAIYRGMLVLIGLLVLIGAAPRSAAAPPEHTIFVRTVVDNHLS